MLNPFFACLPLLIHPFIPSKYTLLNAAPLLFAVLINSTTIFPTDFSAICQDKIELKSERSIYKATRDQDAMLVKK